MLPQQSLVSTAVLQNHLYKLLLKDVEVQRDDITWDVGSGYMQLNVPMQNTSDAFFRVEGSVTETASSYTLEVGGVGEPSLVTYFLIKGEAKEFLDRVNDEVLFVLLWGVVFKRWETVFYRNRFDLIVREVLRPVLQEVFYDLDDVTSIEVHGESGAAYQISQSLN